MSIDLGVLDKLVNKFELASDGKWYARTYSGSTLMYEDEITGYDYGPVPGELNDIFAAQRTAVLLGGRQIVSNTNPLTGVIKKIGSNRDALYDIGVPKRIAFTDFTPSIVASLIAGATASRAGDVITVTAAAHGLPASTLDGYRFYFPGSANILAGWKTGFARTGVDTITCIDDVSGSVSSEVVNSGAVWNTATRISGIVIPGGLMGPRGTCEVKATRSGGTTAASKTISYNLAGVQIMRTPGQAGTPGGVFRNTFSNIGVENKQVGYIVQDGTPGSSAGNIYATVDMSTDQMLDVWGQVSAEKDYLVLLNVGATITHEIEYKPDLMTFKPLTDWSFSELPSSAPRVIISRLNDGYLYGKHDNGHLYRSSDGARTWSDLGAGLGSDNVTGILPAGDGEALLIGSANLYRTTGWGTGSITRTGVLASGTSAYFSPWAVDTNGAGRCVATHYHGSSYTQSRYVWYSGDSGATWTVVRDLSATSENDQHLHFAMFDKYSSGRIYINHHQETAGGSGKAIEYSDNNGATWSSVKQITVVQSDGTLRMLQPTTAVALPEGIVFGSDDPDTGLYILRRGSTKAEKFAAGVVEDGPLGTRCFATYSQIDPYSGHVYTCFKQQSNYGFAYIMANNGVRGDVVFAETAHHPTTGQTTNGSALPGFYHLAFTEDEVVGMAVRPSANDPLANVYWTFRASKSVLEI